MGREARARACGLRGIRFAYTATEQWRTKRYGIPIPRASLLSLGDAAYAAALAASFASTTWSSAAGAFGTTRRTLDSSSTDKSMVCFRVQGCTAAERSFDRVQWFVGFSSV